MATNIWDRGQITKIKTQGALKVGSKVTVLQKYTEEDMQSFNENMKRQFQIPTVKCSYNGNEFNVSPLHLEAIEDPMWRKGQQALLIYSVKDLSKHDVVIIESNYEKSKLTKFSNEVGCTKGDKHYFLSPEALYVKN
jgi:hypothetical protein